MKESGIFRKIWNIFTTAIVILAVLCAVFLMGSRLLGYRVFNVLSGSMEPNYSVGDLIFVKQVDPNEVKVDDPITFVLNENLVVATHRVIEIDAANQHFYTKGDANDVPDATPVHFNNLIGVPQFAVPLLGYVSDFVQNPPGMYITIAAGVLLIAAVFLPDLIGKKGSEDTSTSAAATASASGYTARPKSCRSCKYYMTDVDLPHPVCTLHEFHFEGDYTPCEKHTVG